MASSLAKDVVGSTLETFDRAPRRGGTSRDRVISENLPLATALARRFASRSEPIDDLVQIASIGLIKAVDGFRRERGDNLGAYAVPTIVGELRRHRRATRWPVRGAPAAAHTRPIAVSLDERLVAPSGEAGLEQGEARAALAVAFRALSKRERRVVGLRFYQDLSQQSIASAVGLSQPQVSRVLAHALEKMREALDPPRAGS